MVVPCQTRRKKDIKNLNQSDSAELAKHLERVLDYEKKLQSSNGGRVTEFEKPEVVIGKEATTIVGDEVLGVFWPAWLYEKTEGSEIPLEHMMEYKGLKGCLRDESHGAPIGAIRLTKRHEDGFQKLTTLADSSTAQREGQVEGVLSQSKRKFGSISVDTKRDIDHDKDAFHTLNLPKPKSLKKSDSTSSGADFLSDLHCPFSKPKGQKPPKQAKIAAGDDDGNPTAIVPKLSLGRSGSFGSGEGSKATTEKTDKKGSKAEAKKASKKADKSEAAAAADDGGRC